MIRVKTGIVTRKYHKKILKLASGYFGSRSKLFRIANESLCRALSYSYRDRKFRKRFFRTLWIIRINAFVRNIGIRYSVFMNYLKLNQIKLNRKIISFLTIHRSDILLKLVNKIKKHC
jgi:large subunit ribosomal protein L20